MVKKDSVMKNINLKVIHNSGKFVTFISAEDDEDTIAHILSDKKGVVTDNFITVSEDNIPLPWQLSITDNSVSLLDDSALVEAQAAEEALGLMNELRRVRNKKLSDTDWWANSDLTMTEEQVAYRQALRDITNDYTSLETVVFPTLPTGE